MKYMGIIVIGLIWGLLIIQRAIRFHRSRRIPPYNH